MCATRTGRDKQCKYGAANAAHPTPTPDQPAYAKPIVRRKSARAHCKPGLRKPHARCCARITTIPHGNAACMQLQ
eukprot:15172097-Alexandrium_andersonii.AAC.1